jgi:protein-disulfide isomerase
LKNLVLNKSFLNIDKYQYVMKIKVIGSGCPTCTKLHQWVIKLKQDGKIDKNADVEYSKDINELIELGVMGSPALVVDGKVANVGMPENQEKLIEIIKKSSK